MDLSIYLVTDTVMCGQFGVADTVLAAVGAGVTGVQLRDHGATDDELVSLGRQVLAAMEGTDVPLIVNDRLHLVDAIKIGMLANADIVGAVGDFLTRHRHLVDYVVLDPRPSTTSTRSGGTERPSNVQWGSLALPSRHEAAELRLLVHV